MLLLTSGLTLLELRMAECALLCADDFERKEKKQLQLQLAQLRREHLESKTIAAMVCQCVCSNMQECWSHLSTAGFLVPTTDCLSWTGSTQLKSGSDKSEANCSGVQ